MKLTFPLGNPAPSAAPVLVSLSPAEGGRQRPHHPDTGHAGHSLRGQMSGREECRVKLCGRQCYHGHTVTEH